MSTVAEVNKGESFSLTFADVVKMTLKQRKVLRTLFGNYHTRRELSKMLDIEISSLCSIMKRLQKLGLIREAFGGVDGDTGRMVTYYTSTKDCDNLLIFNDMGGLDA